MVKLLGLSVKGAPRSEGVVQYGHFADKEVEGSLQMWTSALFGEKLQIFRNLWCTRTDKGSLVNADKRGGGRFFAILCGRLLWTAP